jgi:hypothetical protein
MGDGAVRLGAGEGRTPAQPDAKTDGIRTAKIQHRDQAVLILSRRNLEYHARLRRKKTEAFSIGPYADLIVAWPYADYRLAPSRGGFYLARFARLLRTAFAKCISHQAVINHQSATGLITNRHQAHGHSFILSVLPQN